MKDAIGILVDASDFAFGLFLHVFLRHTRYSLRNLSIREIQENLPIKILVKSNTVATDA